MTSGFECYNDSGAVQASTEAVNFFLAQKGSVNISAAPGYPTWPERPFAKGVIAPTVDYDAIAVYCTTAMVMPHGIYGTTQTAGTQQTFRMEQQGGTVFWYAFRSYHALTPRTSDHGIELYNADGKVAFSDAQSKMMRYYGRIPLPSSATVNMSVPTSGFTPACLLYGASRSRRSRQWYDYDDKGARVTISRTVDHQPTVRWTSGNIAADANTVPSSMLAASGVNAYTSGILVLDVTGY